MSTSDSCKDGASKSSYDGCDANNMLQNIRLDNNSVSVCTNCGKGEEESHKLKTCAACELVKYCSRECQIAHRPMHKKECRRRAAELHDIELFKQRPPPTGDCPICFLRIPSLVTGRRYKSCCGNFICSGCYYAPVFDHLGNIVTNKKCPYCRSPMPLSTKEESEQVKNRMEAGEAYATYDVGFCYAKGLSGFPQDMDKALELLLRAVELGYIQACCDIGRVYEIGNGVVADKKKARYYYELGVLGGDVGARHNLGCMEEKAGNMDRAVKHWMNAAKGGLSESLDTIRKLYSDGLVTKEEYKTALQEYQAYLGQIKSEQRDKAAAADDDYRYY